MQAILIGFPLGILSAAALTAVLRLIGIAPDTLLPEDHALTLFIAEPNWYSVIVAVLAGVVGVLALVGAKSTVLVGVLISVTTIPAAANVGVAAVYGNWESVKGAATQLVINVLAIVVSGITVLWVIKRDRIRRALQGSGPARRDRV